MDAGRVLATGTPAELMQRTGTTDLEKCFIALLPEEKRSGHKEVEIPPRAAGKSELAIEAHDLTMRFGTFTAVDRVTLSIERGEIFGFLGSNGCGKSTTMKMLTGLLPPTEGTATLFGSSVEAGSMEVRKNLGYMTQAFSLYGELTVRQNLVLHARLYHLPPDKANAADRRAGRTLRPRHAPRRAGRLAAHGDASAPVARRRGPARAADPDPRRADLGGRSGRARQLLGAADRSVAQSGRHDLRDDALHERRHALRPDLAHARRQGPRLRRAAEADRRSAMRAQLENAFIGYMQDAIAGGTSSDKGKAGATAAAPEQARRGAPPPPSHAKPAGHAAADRPDARLHAQRDHADPARSGPSDVRLPRFGRVDARVRVRHHDRRRAHPLRVLRSGPVA